MKNITISLDDELYRQARIKAAEQGTSVSGLVRNYLLHVIAGAKASWEAEFSRRAAQEQELRAHLFASDKGLRSADNLTREELHDRDALR
jgi:plasmid stability protein